MIEPESDPSPDFKLGTRPGAMFGLLLVAKLPLLRLPGVTASGSGVPPREDIEGERRSEIIEAESDTSDFEPSTNPGAIFGLLFVAKLPLLRLPVEVEASGSGVPARDDTDGERRSETIEARLVRAAGEAVKGGTGTGGSWSSFPFNRGHIRQ